MDITPLYELRVRLRTAAIAGSNLCEEDFRLKHSVEALKPLESASPVFAKIGQLTNALITPGGEDKAGQLLEALSLVDAVLCTQAKVDADGELQPLLLQETVGVIHDIPYSRIKDLMEALSSSGERHFAHVLELHKKNEELFLDYRVIPLLVGALGTSYTALAEKASMWLRAMGKPILPLLKKGFEPNGKKEMTRRVQVIDEIAGQDENDFYVKQLTNAVKETKIALIYALRHSQENEELLLTLAKTEKGNAKNVACSALVWMEGKGAQEFFGKLAIKNEEDTLSYIRESGTAWASRLAADELHSFMQKFEDILARKGKVDEEVTGEQRARFIRYLYVLEGKDCHMVSGCCERLAKLAESSQMQQVKFADGPMAAADIKVITAKHLFAYMLVRPDEELCRTALQLYEKSKGTKNGEAFFPAALLAHMLQNEDSTPWIEAELKQDKKSVLLSVFAETLEALCWNEEKKTWAFEARKADYDKVKELRPVRQQVKGTFTQFIMKLQQRSLDMVLSRCIPEHDSEYEEELLEYFYQKARKDSGPAHGSNSYCDILRQYGFPKCEGIAVNRFQYLQEPGAKVKMSYIAEFIYWLPGTDEAKRAEVKALFRMIQEKRLSAKIENWNEDFFTGY